MAWFVSLLLELFGYGTVNDAVAAAERVVADAVAALVRNVAAIGITDGARFLADARAMSAQVQATDKSGPQKFELYISGVKQLVVDLGGNLEHDLTTSVLNTLAELFHQPDAATPPDSARTLGSTGGGTQ